MGGWLDGWAKRAAQASPAAESDVTPRAAEASSGTSASSRRDFLKKAGIVGGIAWSVPVMQTVMAPAASASFNTGLGGNCAGSPPGAGPGSDCAAGNAICSPLNICGGAGASCAGGKACFNSNCSTGGVCGGTGATCTGSGQCASPRTCSARTGDSTVCGGSGSACSTNADCLYANCYLGTCGRGDGGQNGAPCGVNGTTTGPGNNSRCANGFTCSEQGNQWRCR